MKRILCLSDSLSYCHSFWIRIGQYLEPIKHKFHITITDNANLINTLAMNDVLIIYRHSNEWGDISESLRNAKKLGITIISDIDDYLWFDGEKRGWDKRRLKWYKKALLKCDIVTCSTEILKYQLEVMFTKQKIIVLANTSPQTSIKKRTIDNSKTKIGWTGAPWTRPGDLKLLVPLGKWIIENTDKYQLVHIGNKDKMPTFASILKIPEEYVEKKPLQKHQDYLNCFDFDIGLAPMTRCCFNKFKSPIKVIEYSYFGIPWVASNVETYRQHCSNWGWEGRLCQSSDDWIRHIQELDSKLVRIDEGIELKEKCNKHSSYKGGVNRWLGVIEGY